MGRRNYTILNTETIWKDPGWENDFVMKSITTVTVASPKWQQQQNQNVTINFFFQYKPRSTVEDIYNESIIPLLEGGTDILFFNFGLHWRLQEQDSAALKQHMLTTMTALKQHAVGSGKVSLFAFRETSAQHFDTPLGDWPRARAPYNCTPLDTKKPLFGWRTPDILNAIEKSGFTSMLVDPSGKTPTPPLQLQHSDQQNNEVAFVPFTEFSSDFYDLHPSECTHFCHTPHLWNPLWRSLRLAMERRFVG
jgi:hypothetical protein